MIIVTIDLVPGKEIGEALGVAHGSTIRAKNIGKDHGRSLAYGIAVYLRLLFDFETLQSISGPLC
jgi:uncharacterized protein YbjQ (UPF0145 family)